MEKDNTLSIILITVVVCLVVSSLFAMLFLVSNKLSIISSQLSNISNGLSEIDYNNDSKIIEETEVEATEENWDVSVVFNKAHKNPFYPFSKIEGKVGEIYYTKLNKSDDLYEEYVGGECCEHWSSSYHYDKFEKEERARAKGWYAERKKIDNDKYKILLRGIAWADCSYEGNGYVEGELNLNLDSDWKVSEVIKCSAQRSNKDQKVYCETSENFVKFAAGSPCGGCCACADSGRIDIEIIVEK